MNRIGIRQGRLLQATPGKRPGFPWHTWTREFVLAAHCGFDAIEWLFAAEGHDRNPIWTDDGLKEIQNQIAGTGTEVRSLCADYFISHPLVRVRTRERADHISVLNTLIVRSTRAGIRTIVLPVLEGGELRHEDEHAQLLESLEGPLAVAAGCGARLAVETDLPARACRALVERAAHPALGICYDTGNAVARGYDVPADLRILSPHVCAVHLKDRTRNGPSVPLGQGAVDFRSFFQTAEEIGYAGLLVLETPPAGEDPAHATAQLAFLAQQR